MVLPQITPDIPADIDVLQILMDQVIRSTPSTGLVLGLVALYYWWTRKGRSKK